MLRKIVTPHNVGELLQLGTVITVASLALTQTDADAESDSVFTFNFAARMLGLNYSFAKYLDAWGIENNAQAIDDKLYPHDKIAKNNVVLANSNNINKTGTTGTTLGIIGLISGSTALQQACAVLGPLAASAQTALAGVTADTMKEAPRSRDAASNLGVDDKQANDAEGGKSATLLQPAKPVAMTPVHEAEESTVAKILTLRNGATFIIIGSTVVLSYFAVNKNDKSSEHAITFSLLAKLMNIGLTLSSNIQAYGLASDAHSYDDRVNPSEKSQVSDKQSKLKIATITSGAVSGMGLVGLFSDTLTLRKACTVLSPIVNGATKILASLYGDEVRKNAHGPRSGK